MGTDPQYLDHPSGDRDTSHVAVDGVGRWIPNLPPSMRWWRLLAFDRRRIDSPSDSPDNEDVLGARSVLPTENERQGGLAVWAPSIVPPIGIELSDEQKMACTFRILAHEGFSEHIAGHITWQRDGHDTLLVNPWGLWWNEIAASDLCTVDMDANVVAGKWDVTPAIHIHTELHRRRRDARVVIHNHPYSVCVMASLGRLPELLHQTGTMYDEDMVLISEYGGEIDSRALGPIWRTASAPPA